MLSEYMQMEGDSKRPAVNCGPNLKKILPWLICGGLGTSAVAAFGYFVYSLEYQKSNAQCLLTSCQVFVDDGRRSGGPITMTSSGTLSCDDINTFSYVAGTSMHFSGCHNNLTDVKLSGSHHLLCNTTRKMTGEVCEAIVYASVGTC